MTTNASPVGAGPEGKGMIGINLKVTGPRRKTSDLGLFLFPSVTLPASQRRPDSTPIDHYHPNTHYASRMISHTTYLYH